MRYILGSAMLLTAYILYTIGVEATKISQYPKVTALILSTIVAVLYMWGMKFFSKKQ